MRGGIESRVWDGRRLYLHFYLIGNYLHHAGYHEIHQSGFVDCMLSILDVVCRRRPRVILLAAGNTNHQSACCKEAIYN